VRDRADRDGQSVTGDPDLDRLDLALPERAPVDRAGGAQQVAGPGQRIGAQPAGDVDHRDAGAGDTLRAEQDEVGVAVTVGIDGLDVDDPAARAAAVRRRRRAGDGREMPGLRPRGRLRLRVGRGGLVAAAAAEGDGEGGERAAESRSGR
jgi:hypothetical protein